MWGARRGGRALWEKDKAGAPAQVFPATPRGTMREPLDGDLAAVAETLVWGDFPRPRAIACFRPARICTNRRHD